MVHQTISNSSTNAPNASSRSKTMNNTLCKLANAVIVGTLVACSSAPQAPTPTPVPILAPAPPTRAISGKEVTPGTLPPVAEAASSKAVAGPLPASVLQAKSQWVAVTWADLPGFEDDALHEAWNAWLKSCERPGPVFAPLCPDVRRLSIASAPEQRAWLVARLQPYRVEALGGGATPGLLTGYFEPVMEASRLPSAAFSVPLYQTPAGLSPRQPWFTRQEMETLPAAKAALKGREIAYLADPIDALILQIQGSGRMRITQPDGSQKWVRLAFAGSNEQPYKSVGRWLLDQGALRDASWPGIKAWAAQNPTRVNDMLWSNPRTVFFREEALGGLEASFGPKGAQGVALTPGRSIAVDPGSIPYGTPVWLASRGPSANLQKLVLAQDTGSAIVGAVRADYFAGWSSEAAELAGRLKQPLSLWVLWPR